MLPRGWHVLVLLAAPRVRAFMHSPSFVAAKRLSRQPILTVAPLIRMAAEEVDAPPLPSASFPSASSPSSDERITAIFRELDVSGDGFIDLGELQAALTKVEGVHVTLQRAKEILEQVDENGDGQISLEEFEQVFRLDAPDTLKRLASTLASFDLFIDEVRNEVSGTPFNGPILPTVATATFMGVFWKYIVAFSSLVQNDASSQWLPE